MSSATLRGVRATYRDESRVPGEKLIAGSTSSHRMRPHADLRLPFVSCRMTGTGVTAFDGHAGGPARRSRKQPCAVGWSEGTEAPAIRLCFVQPGPCIRQWLPRRIGLLGLHPRNRPWRERVTATTMLVTLHAALALQSATSSHRGRRYLLSRCRFRR
jgi:hypothetical protein